MLKVKVQFGNDIRIWRFPESKRYQNLLQFAKQTFNFLDERQFYVQFEDDEGDHLTLTSEADFEDAFSSALQEGRKSLKIFIVKGSIEDSHSNKNQFSFSPVASVSSHVQQPNEKSQVQVQPQQQQQQQQQQQSNQRLEQEEQEEQELKNDIPNDEYEERQIHDSVTCDGCQRHPITGIRYKCSVCNNYDLCENCESSGKHDRSHPMLKIQSTAACSNFRYVGLHEFLKHSWRRRRSSSHPSHPFHPRGHHFWSHCRRRVPEFWNYDFYNMNNNNNENNNSCSNEKNISGQFISDVTIPDKSYCSTDTIMTKTWRVRNNGNVEWGDNVELVFLKGDESLLLEKRFPVANAKPGEEVDVSAVIKTPLQGGFYATYFRLQKNDKFFGDELWVELYAVQENLESSELKQQIEKHAICECGKLLIGMFSHQAYNGNSVFCNICSKQCALNEIIYHCPDNKNQTHKDGYDMCSSCVDIIMPTLVSIQSNKNVQQNENKDQNSNNNNNNNNNVQNGNENKNDEFLQIPSVPVINENGKNQNENPSPKNSEPEIIEMDDITDDENDGNKKNQQNEDDTFEYKTQLNSLKEMGFNDISTLKFLLVKHKGDVQHVVQELLIQI